MSAPVLPDDAPQLGKPGDFESLLIAQLEAQQTHIAQELHDAVGSRLAAIMMMLGAVKALHAQDKVARAALAQVMAHVEVTAEATRRLARGLMPVDTAPGGLWRMLERLCADYDQLQGLACSFAMQGNFDSVPHTTANHLYRIAQEAITNALRHGRARQITLSLAQQGAHYEMAISDDGAGWNMAHAAAHTVGAGLRSVRMRCTIIQAELTIQSSLLHGTSLKVVWTAALDNSKEFLLRATT
jgi:signal transduction histidine kinase